MNTGIKPKVSTQGRLHNEHARRFIFYPLSNLDFAGTQGTSPIWSPKITKGKITLLESFEYMAQVTEGETEMGYNGVRLGSKIMGTDAQVKFLMGDMNGDGFIHKGMSYLDSMTDLDYQTAQEISDLLCSFDAPENLNEFKDILNAIVIPEDTPVGAIAVKTRAEMVEGLDRAIRFCNQMVQSLAKELAEGKAGRIGIKSLDATQQFYFRSVGTPLPEDRAGANMGSELAKALAPLLGQLPQTQPQTNVLAVEAELEALRNQLAIKDATIAEQTEAIEALSAS